MEWVSYPVFLSTHVHWLLRYSLTISSGPLNNMQLHIINNLRNFLVFFRQLSLYISFEQQNTKILSSSPWSMQILDSLLNIFFIQLSTYCDCFSLVHVKLSFFSLFVSAAFFFAFLDVYPILYNQFLTVHLQTLIPVLNYLFCFFCTFSIFRAHCFQFFILIIWHLSWSTGMFPYFNHPISWPWITNVCHIIPPGTAFFNEFYNPLYCFNWHFFHWNHVSFPVV